MISIHITKNAEKFFKSLDSKTYAKTLRTIELLESYGYQLGMPHCKKIEQDLYELRIRGKREIRILYAFQKNHIVLLHGFIKKTQRLPARELTTARAILAKI